MNIGITFDLKNPALADAGQPDDAQEEFDSPATIDAIARVLREMGHHVTYLGDGREFLEAVFQSPPDFVFNFAEGTGVSRSREARVPAVLEMLGIPFTGSDPLTMAVTLDKAMAKTIAASAGVRVPAAHDLQPDEPLDAAKPDRLIFPLVAKPAWEGSSKGIRDRCLVLSPAELPAVVASLRREHRQTILLEEYIAGDELTVGVYGNAHPKILGIMRVVPRKQSEHFIYSLEVKRDYKNQVTYECPAPLRPEQRRAVEEASLTVFRALGCRDIARIDFRLKGDVPYFLEVNPLPGLNPEDSDLVIMARQLNWSFRQLIETIVHTAWERHAPKNFPEV